mmetsp:Transcript_73582/g.225048  ORF Transcript_73582/g.225048 Transcript_73582/m.225048 type:complete len:361 (-) Transcript_73582:218-1300(-)
MIAVQPCKSRASMCVPCSRSRLTISLWSSGGSSVRRLLPRFDAWCSAFLCVSSSAFTSTSGFDSRNSTNFRRPKLAEYMSAFLPRTSPLFKLGLVDVEENQPSLLSATLRTASTSPATEASSSALIFRKRGMKTTPSLPKPLPVASPMVQAPSFTKEIQPVTIGADTFARYRSIGWRSNTVSKVPAFSLAFTSLFSLSSMVTSNWTLVWYLLETTGSKKSLGGSGAGSFETSGSPSLVQLLIQPSMEPLVTCSRRPDTCRTRRAVSTGSCCSAALSKSSVSRKVTVETVMMVSPGKIASVAAAAGVAAARALELRRVGTIFESKAFDAEVTLLTFDVFEQVLAVLMVSQLSVPQLSSSDA